VLNFTSTTKEYNFIKKESNLPVGELLLPHLKKVEIAPARVTFGKGLGYRAKATITLEDFKHDDVGIDPYQSTRTYDTEQGTFFGKLIARNKYYAGRKIRLLTGYVGSGPAAVTHLGNVVTHLGETVTHGLSGNYSISNFETREYLIEKIDGPDSNGNVKIIAVDTLKKIDNDRAQCPAPSTGVLNAGISAAATSATLSPSGVGSEYSSSGAVRMGDEICSYTRSGDVLTLTRGQYGTTAAAHSADDSVQLCKIYNNINCVNICYDLLKNYGNIPDSYLPFNDNPSDPDEWDTEKSLWLEDVTHYTVISQPTGVGTLIEELSYQSMFLIWADTLTQKVKIKAIAPSLPTDTVSTFDDFAHNIQGSIKIEKNDDERLTQLWVSFSPYDWSEIKDSENFEQTIITVAAEEEGADLYGDTRAKHINSRWFNNDTRVSSFGSLLISYAKNTPVTISVSVDAADKIEIGDYVDIKTRTNQDITGDTPYKRFYVMESKETETAHRFDLKLRTSFFDDLDFCFFAPDDAVDYTSDTQDYRDLYWYFTDDDGKNPDGSTGDVFI
jgi:hypothetical protein